MRRWLVVLICLVALAGAVLRRLLPSAGPEPATPRVFDGQAAYAHVISQVDLGPRVTGTQAHWQAGDFILQHLQAAGWEAEAQEFDYRGVRARNLIARANLGRGPVILLGAHYDSRRLADRDPQAPGLPVPGANDGASGVAVLLELASSLDLSRVPNEVWLAFFDAEDNGDLDGWEWIVGSTVMAGNLSEADVARIQSMILLDMVGDADQQFYFDTNSDLQLSARLWAAAAGLGYQDQFIPQPKWSMLDDHIPFARRGIPSVDIIDFDYAYWHTAADTPDKVSALSLERIGRTLAAFLETGDD